MKRKLMLPLGAVARELSSRPEVTEEEHEIMEREYTRRNKRGRHGRGRVAS